MTSSGDRFRATETGTGSQTKAMAAPNRDIGSAFITMSVRDRATPAIEQVKVGTDQFLAHMQKVRTLQALERVARVSERSCADFERGRELAQILEPSPEIEEMVAALKNDQWAPRPHTIEMPMDQIARLVTRAGDKMRRAALGTGNGLSARGGLAGRDYE